MQGSTIAFVHIDHNGIKTIASGGIATYIGTVFPVEVVLTSDGAKIYITSVKALQFVTTNPTTKITMQSDQVGVSRLSPDLTIK